MRASSSSGPNGFDEVVVCARLEAGDPVAGVGARGEHDDRNAAALTHFAEHFEAVEPGQHAVEQHEIVALFQGACEPAPAVVLDVEADAMRLEEIAHQPAQLMVVVDEQHRQLDRQRGRDRSGLDGGGGDR